MRSLIKGVAERALVWSGAAAWHRRRVSGRVLVLAYHNIVPDGEPPAGDLANHLPLSRFVTQVDLLEQTHDVIPLEEALLPSSEARGRGRPRVAITFDDAYGGAVEHGIGELVRRGLPATIFVAPAFLGGHSFWWDALARDGNAGLDPEVRSRALGELRGEDAAVRAWASANRHDVHDLPPALCAATEDDVLRASRLPGITLGSHTWSHPNLPLLGPEELRSELERPLAWLRERVAKPLPWIAYPYGLHDASVMRAARDAGYVAALGVSGGWLAQRPTELLSLPRVNIPPGVSSRGFSLRAAGLLCS
ncbi:MAG TPA: polysaccharide deacetylase family protein [Gemmatimonadaceae bacterium]|nr:polysaccharide deacetylase family protein [Gemmatimonadaceae bacterium]